MDFKGVELYAARKYVHLEKEVREEELFVYEAEEQEYEYLPQQLVWNVYNELGTTVILML